MLSNVIFHERLSSIKGCLLLSSKLVFHPRSSYTSIKVPLTSKVILHQDWVEIAFWQNVSPQTFSLGGLHIKPPLTPKESKTHLRPVGLKLDWVCQPPLDPSLTTREINQGRESLRSFDLILLPIYIFGWTASKCENNLKVDNGEWIKNCEKNLVLWCARASFISTSVLVLTRNMACVRAHK